MSTEKLFPLPLGHTNITTCFHLTLPRQSRPLASLFSLLSRLSSRLVIFFICLYHHYFSHCQACCCVSKICFQYGYLSPFSCTRVDKNCNLIQKYACGAVGGYNQICCVHMCWLLPKGLSVKAAELTMVGMETWHERLGRRQFPIPAVPSATKEMSKSSSSLNNTKH